MTYLRAGLLGCGEGAAAIAARCRWHGHLDLVALCDPDPARTRSLAERTGIERTCLRVQDLLASGVDFVIARMPPPERDEALARLLHDAVPCLVHAPLAAEAQRAEELALAAAAGGTRLGVWLRGLEDPTLHELRAQWEGEAIGEPDLARITADPDAEVPDQDLAGPLALLSWVTGRRVAEVAPGAARARLGDGLLVELQPGNGPAIELRGSDGVLRWRAAGIDPLDDSPRHRACDPIGRFAAWLDDGDDFPLTGDEALAHVALLEAVRRARHGDG